MTARAWTDPRDVRRLRRYVLARVAGREATGWTRRVDLAPDLSTWVWCTADDASAVQPRSDVRRVRTPGQPWCRWLGADVSVAADLILQAAIAAVPDNKWATLAAEARRKPAALLLRLREEGKRLLAAADGRPVRGPLADAYTTRGRGHRSLIPCHTR